MDETKLTAALPNLDVQILHRTLPEEGAEMISITLKATPDFASARALLAPGFPALAASPMLALWTAPMQAWSGLMRQAWAPWLNALEASARRLEDRQREGRRDGRL